MIFERATGKMNVASLVERKTRFGPAPGLIIPKIGPDPALLHVLLPDEMRRLKALEDENTRLKKIVADLTLDREMLQDVIRRKL